MKPVIIIAIAFVLLIPLSAFGQSSFVVTIERSLYAEGQTVLVLGEVSEILDGTAVTLIVKDPNGNIVTIAQVTVSADKKFSSEFVAGGPLWNITGTYTVAVKYGGNTTEPSFFFFATDTTPPTPEPEPKKKSCDALDKASENGKGKKKGLERAIANNNC